MVKEKNPDGVIKIQNEKVENKRQNNNIYKIIKSIIKTQKTKHIKIYICG
jgi:hypothetical protein